MSDAIPGFVSFFSGALGLDLGLELAGLRPLMANEMEKSAVATIRANRPKLPLLDCDVRSITPEMVEITAGVSRGELFAVTGGPPCQAFSTAGRRKGFSDERGNVFLHFLDLAVALQPRFIVIENVRGLLSSPLIHRPHSERGQGSSSLTVDELPGGALHKILAILDKGGYRSSFDLYNVANFGIPQTRERVVLIATSGKKVVPHLEPTHSVDGEGNLLLWESFSEAVIGLDDVGECVEFRAGRKKFFEMLSEGENWKFLSKSMQIEALGKAYFSSGGRVGFCRRLSLDRPAPTLVTSPNMPATELGHPVECRPLSVNEYKRLQTFPDGWKVCGSLSAKYRQIGNAVPVNFGKIIGHHLLEFANGSLVTNKESLAKSRYRNTDEKSWRRKYA